MDYSTNQFHSVLSNLLIKSSNLQNRIKDVHVTQFHQLQKLQNQFHILRPMLQKVENSI